MKRLILFGAPGSGKGTMGDFIQRDFHLIKISTGDILRSAIQQDTADGRQAKSFMESGSLVPDELVIELVHQRLSRGDLDGGYVMRLLSRLTCSACGAIYNLLTKPPKNAGTCDLCRGRIERRADDNEEAVRERFRVYAERTMPVIDYYGRKNVLVRVDGGGSAAGVYEKIKGLIA
jgi:adenylate kinase